MKPSPLDKRAVLVNLFVAGLFLHFYCGFGVNRTTVPERIEASAPSSEPAVTVSSDSAPSVLSDSPTVTAPPEPVAESTPSSLVAEATPSPAAWFRSSETTDSGTEQPDPTPTPYDPWQARAEGPPSVSEMPPGTYYQHYGAETPPPPPPPDAPQPE